MPAQLIISITLTIRAELNTANCSGHPYCLELTLKGWRVTSLRHDCMQGDFTRLDLFTAYYDTLYDLMDELSPGYRNRFNEKLAQKLRMLQVTFIPHPCVCLFCVWQFRLIFCSSLQKYALNRGMPRVRWMHM